MQVRSRPIAAFGSIVAIAVATVGLTAPRAPAAFPGENGKIVFESRRDGSIEIYSMDVNGSDQTALTSTPGSSAEPSFSPDGTRITFISTRDNPAPGGGVHIYVMDADGSNQTRLTFAGGDTHDPSFSPDGAKIVFTSTRDQPVPFDQNIWIMDADGSNQVPLIDPETEEFDPVFSPDGSRIAFVRVTGSGGFDTDVWVMDADGSNQTMLTTALGVDFAPSWSPDGTKILFTSSRNDPDAGTPDADDVQLFTMDADGSDQTALTELGEFRFGTFSPDGSKVAYTDGPTQDGTDIFTMDSDGSNRVNITNSALEDTRPDWGPVPDLNAPPAIAVTPGGTCSDTAGTMHLLAQDVDGDDVTLSATSSDETLIPDQNITFGGAGDDRTIALTAIPAMTTRTATITVTATDGDEDAELAITVIVGAPARATVAGTDGHDLILGRESVDTIDSLGGHDLVCGNKGADTIRGGSGDDTLLGGAGGDRVIGGGGDDEVHGEAGGDVLTGDAGGDAFDGGAGSDTVTDFVPGDGDTRTGVP